VPERVGPPVDSRAATVDRPDRVEQQGPPEEAEADADADRVVDERVMGDDGTPQLSEQFETPSGADWFLRTGNPAPAREDVGFSASSTPAPVPTRPPPSTTTYVVGGLLAVAVGCFAALGLLVYLLVG
jgi:hypothetical protein